MRYVTVETTCIGDTVRSFQRAWVDEGSFVSRDVEGNVIWNPVPGWGATGGVAAGAAVPSDGVPCALCPTVVRPEDSYPVVWTRKADAARPAGERAALCEACFRAEEAAGRARPCAGLDEEAT